MQDLDAEHHDEAEVSSEVDPIDLESFDTFVSHPWLAFITQRYNRDSVIAKHACYRLIKDLHQLDEIYRQQHSGQIAFTSIQGRVKSKDSFLRKLYGKCCERARMNGITQASFQRIYSDI